MRRCGVRMILYLCLVDEAQEVVEAGVDPKDVVGVIADLRQLGNDHFTCESLRDKGKVRMTGPARSRNAKWSRTEPPAANGQQEPKPVS